MYLYQHKTHFVTCHPTMRSKWYYAPSPQPNECIPFSSRLRIPSMNVPHIQIQTASRTLFNAMRKKTHTHRYVHPYIIRVLCYNTVKAQRNFPFPSFLDRKSITQTRPPVQRKQLASLGLAQLPRVSHPLDLGQRGNHDFSEISLECALAVKPIRER
jgi:hypothetical protein